MSHWTFFTNHGHVIFLAAKNPMTTLREMSIEIGITERAVQRIIHDLEDDGFIKINKVGRQNSYKIVGKKCLNHDVEKNCKIKDVIQLING